MWSPWVWLRHHNVLSLIQSRFSWIQFTYSELIWFYPIFILAFDVTAFEEVSKQHFYKCFLLFFFHLSNMSACRGSCWFNWRDVYREINDSNVFLFLCYSRRTVEWQVTDPWRSDVAGEWLKFCSCNSIIVLWGRKLGRYLMASKTVLFVGNSCTW